MAWKNDEEFITVGPKNYMFWKLNGKDTKPEKGSFGTDACNQLGTVSASPTDIFTGAADGSLQIWKDKQLSISKKAMHKKAIDIVSV